MMYLIIWLYCFMMVTYLILNIERWVGKVRTGLTKDGDIAQLGVGVGVRVSAGPFWSVCFSDPSCRSTACVRSSAASRWDLNGCFMASHLFIA